eukprot:CAMPEP_0172426312 /NCGR_PEP_ID=MMETSP1064-20121228/36822_1 /TAXON_ID=202472 /ORGANISM="Aulacoseira subarctica , Strain CCAP 1002/5" /LENGTH=47 /DNA_ID= /DNA_START= /DNA_END= /DNA_ORIENTATION=
MKVGKCSNIPVFTEKSGQELLKDTSFMSSQKEGTATNCISTGDQAWE